MRPWGADSPLSLGGQAVGGLACAGSPGQRPPSQLRAPRPHLPTALRACLQVGQRLLSRWAQEAPGLLQLPQALPPTLLSCLVSRPWAEAVRLVSRQGRGGGSHRGSGRGGRRARVGHGVEGGVQLGWMGAVAAPTHPCRRPRQPEREGLLTPTVCHACHCQAFAALLEAPDDASAPFLPYTKASREAASRGFRRIYPLGDPAAVSSSSAAGGHSFTGGGGGA
jgi:hypothetical protein